MNKPPLHGKELFDYLKKLVTESANPKSENLDRLSTTEILELINSEDATVALEVRRQIPRIAQAVEIVYNSLSKDGRLIYIGAGTSGRLGVLDAAECPPTFGISPEKVVGIIAGGPPTLIRSAEGIEDDIKAGIRDINKIEAGPKDTVMGLTASRRTPYVIAGLNQAVSRGAKTILLCCNPAEEQPEGYDLVITPVVGSEVLSGSTRMKSALTQKMILTMITTTVMIKLGKTFKNMMVDLQATSQKLIERSKRVIMEVVGCNYETAGNILDKAGGHVKTAIVMAKLKCDIAVAEELLEKAGGFVYKALE
ncbi:MAG: N-acetylmuramic acid 6-phosphate etherase [Candidatus Zixiibacteriota bacterium]|nr:MAG: N-acetylmuramic acid 6-phosphate etherase [candidate division Zixibacteria bacterium]